MLENAEAQVAKLSAENQDLINRLLNEKNKMADQLNSLVEGTTRRVSAFSSDLLRKAEEKITANVSSFVSKTPRSIGRAAKVIIPSVAKRTIVSVLF